MITLDPPALASVDGLDVTWRPWSEPARAFVCPGGLATCDRCGSPDLCSTHGLVPPRRDRDVADLHRHPTRRLYASGCAGCGAVTVYDTGPRGDRFDVVAEGQQLDLFEGAR